MESVFVTLKEEMEFEKEVLKKTYNKKRLEGTTRHIMLL